MLLASHAGQKDKQIDEHMHASSNHFLRRPRLDPHTRIFSHKTDSAFFEQKLPITDRFQILGTDYLLLTPHEYNVWAYIACPYWIREVY
jgi:hypothetical protein